MQGIKRHLTILLLNPERPKYIFEQFHITGCVPTKLLCTFQVAKVKKVFWKYIYFYVRTSYSNTKEKLKKWGIFSLDMTEAKARGWDYLM